MPTDKNLNVNRVRKVYLEEEWECDGTVAIEEGDLLYWDTSNDTVKPASSFSWNSNIATTNGEFSVLFVGVAMGSRVVADSNEQKMLVAVDCEAVFPFTAATSGALERGGGVSTCEGSSALLNQYILNTLDGSHNIGGMAEAVVSGAIEASVHFKGAYTGAAAA